MALIGFKNEFAEAILSGVKTSTIRRPRKRPIWEGESLHLYTGLRTKKVRKLGVRVCISVDSIQVGSGGIICGARMNFKWLPPNDPETQEIAKSEGFASYDEMWDWFRRKYGPKPFFGDRIQWR